MFGYISKQAGFTREHKFYAENIGLILESDEDGEEPIELVNMTTE